MQALKDIIPPPPQPSPKSAKPVAAIKSEDEVRLGNERKVRCLINEFLQTGNGFISTCGKLTGLLIRNYFLIVQHIPPQQLNDVILNFFVLAAMPQKTGYKIRGDKEIASLQAIELVEQNSHQIILDNFFPRFDKEKNILVNTSPTCLASEMIERWAAISKLTVFYSSYIGILETTIFKNECSFPPNKEEFLENFFDLLKQLLAHCFQKDKTLETKLYRQFILIQSLLRTKKQWQILLNELSSTNEKDFSKDRFDTILVQQNFMQLVRENPHKVAVKIFNLVENIIKKENFITKESVTQTINKFKFRIEYHSLVHVIVAVTLAKKSPTMQNGAYPTDFDVITNQTITPLQRLPRESMLMTSIKELMDETTPYSLAAQFIASEIAELLDNINTKICIMVFKRELLGSFIEEVDKILSKAFFREIFDRDFVRLRANYFLVRTWFALSGGKIAKGYVSENVVNAVSAIYNWLKEEYEFDAEKADLLLKTLKNQVVVKNEARLGLELRRLKALVEEKDPDNLGKKVFRHQNRIEFNNSKKETIEKKSFAKPKKSKKAIISSNQQTLKKTLFQKNKRKTKEKLPFLSTLKKAGAFGLGIFFLISIAAIIVALTSGQLPFDTSFFHLDFMQNLAKNLGWGKEGFFSIFVVAISSAETIVMGAIIFAVVRLEEFITTLFSKQNSTNVEMNLVADQVDTNSQSSLEDIVGSYAVPTPHLSDIAQDDEEPYGYITTLPTSHPPNSNNF